jgi:hypothetical protein
LNQYRQKLVTTRFCAGKLVGQPGQLGRNRRVTTKPGLLRTEAGWPETQVERSQIRSVRRRLNHSFQPIETTGGIRWRAGAGSGDYSAPARRPVSACKLVDLLLVTRQRDGPALVFGVTILQLVLIRIGHSGSLAVPSDSLVFRKAAGFGMTFFGMTFVSRSAKRKSYGWANARVMLPIGRSGATFVSSINSQDDEHETRFARPVKLPNIARFLELAHPDITTPSMSWKPAITGLR